MPLYVQYYVGGDEQPVSLHGEVRGEPERGGREQLAWHHHLHGRQHLPPGGDRTQVTRIQVSRFTVLVVGTVAIGKAVGPRLFSRLDPDLGWKNGNIITTKMHENCR